MRHTLRNVTAFLSLGLPLLLQAADDAKLGLDSPGRLVLTELSEYRVYPLTGTLRINVDSARLSDDLATFIVLINDAPVNEVAVRLGAREAYVDYQFAPGLNEVQVVAQDREQRHLQADALVWAGEQTLAVDVMSASQIALDSARITVALAEQPTVKSDGKTLAGSVFFQNLPPVALTVTVRLGNHFASRIVPAGTGFVAISLDTVR